MTTNEIVKEILEMVKNGDSEKVEKLIQENKPSEPKFPDDLVRRRDVYEMLDDLDEDVDQDNKQYELGWYNAADKAIDYLRELPSAGSCRVADANENTDNDADNNTDTDHEWNCETFHTWGCNDWGPHYDALRRVIDIPSARIFAFEVDTAYGRAIIVVDHTKEQSAEILKLKEYGYCVTPFSLDDKKKVLVQRPQEDKISEIYLVYRGNEMEDLSLVSDQFFTSTDKGKLIHLNAVLYDVSLHSCGCAVCTGAKDLHDAVEFMIKDQGELNFMPPVMGFKITHASGMCKNVHYEENVLYEADYSPFVHHRGFHFSTVLETLENWYNPCEDDEIYLVQPNGKMDTNKNIHATNRLYVAMKIGTYKEVFSE